MTLVRMFFSRPEASGILTPATGSLSWTPTRRRVVDGTPDNVVLPRAFSVPLVVGKADITVAPTGADWVWKVDEYISGGAYTTIYVSVPNVAEVDYASLVQVDIDTLSPTAVPEPAWVVMAESTVTTGTVTGDDLILTRTDGITVNAGNVRGAAGPVGAQGADSIVPGPQGPVGPEGQMEGMNVVSGLQVLLNPGVSVSTSHSAGYTLYHPIYIPEGLTVVEMWVYVTTGVAGATSHFALYTNSDRVFTRVVDFGSVDSSVAGAKTIAGTWTIPAGALWLGYLNVGGNVWLQCTSTTPNIPGPIVTTDPYNDRSSLRGPANQTSLPATFTQAGSWPSESAYPPRVALKIA